MEGKKTNGMIAGIDPALSGSDRTVKVFITIEGGVIQRIDDIPPGVTVVVMDYDVDGGEPNLCINDNGDQYVHSEWVG